MRPRTEVGGNNGGGVAGVTVCIAGKNQIAVDVLLAAQRRMAAPIVCLPLTTDIGVDGTNRTGLGQGCGNAEWTRIAWAKKSQIP